MKKIIAFAFAALAIASCGDNNATKPVDDSEPKKVSMTDSLAGDWLSVGQEPTDEISDTMGVTLKKDGTAQSINMPTYQYKKWSLKGDTIILTAVSTPEGMPGDTTVVDSGLVDMKANTFKLFSGDITYKRKQ